MDLRKNRLSHSLPIFVERARIHNVRLLYFALLTSAASCNVKQYTEKNGWFCRLNSCVACKQSEKWHIKRFKFQKSPQKWTFFAIFKRNIPKTCGNQRKNHEKFSFRLDSDAFSSDEPTLWRTISIREVNFRSKFGRKSFSFLLRKFIVGAGHARATKAINSSPSHRLCDA